MLEITHVTQQPTTCVSACLAMALGLSQERVISEFHEDYFQGKTSLGKYLTSKGVAFTPIGFEESFFPEDDEYLYFVTVPSLNIEGGFHQILWHWWNGGNRIFDPAQGLTTKKGKRGKQRRKFYVASDTELRYDKLARVNKGRIIDLVVSAEELQKFRSTIGK